METIFSDVKLHKLQPVFQNSKSKPCKDHFWRMLVKLVKKWWNFVRFYIKWPKKKSKNFDIRVF